MKRLMLATVVAWILALVFLTLSAHAAIVQPPGGTFGKQKRTISVWYHGYNMVRVVTQALPNGCKTITTTYYAFWIPTNETVETVCP